MKIYRIINDGIHITTVTDELTALRLFYKLMQKHDSIADWGWIDKEII